MLNRDSEIVIRSRFVNCELWSCDMNSTLGSVVPLAMFLPCLVKVFVFVFAAPVERLAPDQSFSPRSPPAAPPTSSSKLLLGSWVSSHYYPFPRCQHYHPFQNYWHWYNFITAIIVIASDTAIIIFRTVNIKTNIDFEKQEKRLTWLPVFLLSAEFLFAFLLADDKLAGGGSCTRP